MRRAFITLSDSGRQVHYRSAGDGAPLVLLAATPDSSGALDLSAPDRAVFALDTPGYGQSDPLPVAAPTIEHYAEALSQTLDALGLQAADIIGWGSGATIAAGFARRYPERSKSVTMH